MLKRLRASMANPSAIPQYKGDNVLLVLLYIIVLSFIAALPVLIKSVKTSGASVATKYEIREILIENRDDFIEGNINDNTLTITNKVEGTVIGDKVAIILPTDEYEPTNFLSVQVYYAVKLNEHNIEVYFFGSKIKTYTYTNLGLDGIDFSFLHDNNYKERAKVFEQIEAAYDKVINDVKPFWTTFNVLSEFFMAFSITIMFSLVLAFLGRGIKGLVFKESFVMAMYAFAMSAIGQVLDALYGFNLFAYIGCFIGFVYYIFALRNTGNVKTDNI